MNERKEVQTVTISLVDELVKVDPDIVVIRKNMELTWDIQVPAHVVTEVDFRLQGSTKGPFPRGTNSLRGRYDKTGTGTIVTERPDSLGFWKYDVVLRDRETRNDLDAIDPGVVVKEGG